MPLVPGSVTRFLEMPWVTDEQTRKFDVAKDSESDETESSDDDDVFSNMSSMLGRLQVSNFMPWKAVNLEHHRLQVSNFMPWKAVNQEHHRAAFCIVCDNGVGVHECVQCGRCFCGQHCDLVPQVYGLLPDSIMESYACQDCTPNFLLLVDREFTLQRLRRLANAHLIRSMSVSLQAATSYPTRRSAGRKLPPPEACRSCIDCGQQGSVHCQVCGLFVCRWHCSTYPRTAGHNAPGCVWACCRCREHAFARAAAHTAVRLFVAAAFRSSVSNLPLEDVLPGPERAPDCASCGLVFARRSADSRRHCGVCGLTLCVSCLCGRSGGCVAGAEGCEHSGRLPQRKGGRGSHICCVCSNAVRKRLQAEAIVRNICLGACTRAEHCSRVLTYIDDPNLLPLYEQTYVDRARHKAVRAGDFALNGVSAACANVPIGLPSWLGIASQAVTAVWENSWYVLFGILSGSEFVEVFETLKILASSLPSIEARDLMTGAVYLSAFHRKALRDAPRGAIAEIRAHGGKEVPLATLQMLLELASLGMHVPYETQAFEAQRLALQQHWRLVEQRLATSALRRDNPGQSWKPPLAWCLFIHRTEKIAVLAIRGTELQSSCGSDILINADAIPERLHGVGGRSILAHRGMLAAARSLEADLRPCFKALSDANHKIIFTGHSLGGAVSALLLWLSRYGADGEQLPDGTQCTGIGYGVPAMMDYGSALDLQTRFTSVVNSFDAVSRLTAGTAAKLGNEINSCAKQSSTDWDADTKSYYERLLKFWEPRMRHNVQPLITLEGNALTQMTLTVQQLGSAEAMPPSVHPRCCLPQESTSSSKGIGHDAEDLFVPGQIIWIHRIDGHLDAAVVPNDLPSLRRIIFDKRMMRDHTKVAIHQALMSVYTRRCSPALYRHDVQWQSFANAGDTCPCCNNPFNWMSTSRSRKQRCQSMTNCRACGVVVCTGCASTRMSLPGQVYLDTSRVCDRCTWRVPFHVNDDGTNKLAALGKVCMHEENSSA